MCPHQNSFTFVGAYPYTQTIYCTQPVDLLDAKRVAYYEDLIKAGKRPALLSFVAETDLFLIDGHHKVNYLSLVIILHCGLV